MTLKTLAVALLAALSLGLVGYALHVVTSVEPARPRPRVAEAKAARAPALPAGSRESRFLETARALDAAQRGALAQAPPSLGEAQELLEEVDDNDEADADEASGRRDAMPVSRAAAEAAFERLLGEVEQLEPANLRYGDQDRLYREVNDAFTALSIHLGEDELDVMEDAFRRMQSEVGRLRLRQPPRPPEVVVEGPYTP